MVIEIKNKNYIIKVYIAYILINFNLYKIKIFILIKYRIFYIKSYF